MSRHTSLKVGGLCDWFADPTTAEAIPELLRWATGQGIPVRFVGGGSNLLVADAGVGGLVVHVRYDETSVEERDGEPVLVAGAGANFANLARRLAKQGLGGLEWASNVPGTVGGAVVNNAGAFGGDTQTDLIAATIVDAAGTLTRLLNADLRYAYRTSRLKRREMGDVAVLQAEFRLRRTSAAESTALVQRYQEQRTKSQPRQLSAGSVFANPPGDYAGRLIESVGLKGHTVGGAQFSTQHANFIVNRGRASAADVFQLVQDAQQAVYAARGRWLRPEIELFGRWTEEQRSRLQPPPGAGEEAHP